MGSSEAEMAFQTCPKLGLWTGHLYLQINHPLDADCSPENSVTLSKEVFSTKGNSQRGLIALPEAEAIGAYVLAG